MSTSYNREVGDIVRDVLPKLVLFSPAFVEAVDFWLRVLVSLIVGGWTLQQWFWKREDRKKKQVEKSSSTEESLE